jgi:hypothetical protein
MVFVNTSLEVAQERNASRDRTLSAERVAQIWKACQNNLGAFQSMFSGNFIIVDNTEYKKYQSKFKNRKTGEIKIVDTVIAQNIQSVFPEFIHTDSNNYLSVDYPRLSTVLIEGVKELDQRYKSLEDKYNELYELVKGKKTSKPRAKTPEKKTPEKKKTPKPRKPRAKKEDK